MADYSFIGKPMLADGQEQHATTANDAIEALSKEAGTLSKSVAAAGTISLTAEESRYGVILLTGAPAGATTVVMDTAVTDWTMFRNDTTGGQTIQVKMFGGTLFTVPASASVLLVSGTKAILFGTDNAPAVLATTAAVGASEELARADHQHARDAIQLVFNAATATWTNQPLASTEFLGLTDRRTKYNLTNFTQVRLIANVEVVGVAGAKLRGEYSTDDITYVDLENGAGSGPEVLIDALGTIVSGFVTMPAGALADVYLRIVGVGGDGAADPQIGLVALQFK